MVNRWDITKFVKNRKIATVYSVFCQILREKVGF